MKDHYTICINLGVARLRPKYYPRSLHPQWSVIDSRTGCRVCGPTTRNGCERHIDKLLKGEPK